MEKTFRYNKTDFTVTVENNGDTKSIEIIGKKVLLNSIKISANEITLNIDGKNQKVYVSQDKNNFYVFTGGRQYVLEKVESGYGSHSPGSGGGGNTVASPMPGNIIKINCKVGSMVKANDVLVIVEAMKMENPLYSPADGKVSKINYKPGDLVDAGAAIVELEISG